MAWNDFFTRWKDKAKKSEVKWDDAAVNTLKLAGDITKGAAKTFSYGPKKLGNAIGTQIVKPIETRRLNKEANTAQLLQQIGQNRQRRGVTSKPFFQSSQRLFTNVANQQANLGKTDQQARRDAISGAWNTALTVAGSGNLAKAPAWKATGWGFARPAVNALVGGGIGSATSILDPNKSVPEGFGEGVGSSFKYAGLNKVLAPFTGTVADSFSKGGPFWKRAAARAISSGLTNVAEDTLDKRFTEQKPLGVSEAAFSFLIGAALQGVEDVSQVRKTGALEDITNPFFEITDGGKIKASQYTRNELGQFAKKIGTTTDEAKKQIDTFVSWYNEPVPSGQMKVKHPDGTTEYIDKMVPRGQAGFVQLGKNQDEPKIVNRHIDPDIIRNNREMIAQLKADGIDIVRTSKGDVDVREYKNIEPKKFDTDTKQVTPEYGMSHRPTKTGGTLADITNGGTLVPKDIYTHPEWYANMNDPVYQESFNVIKKLKGKPDAEVTVYRASSKNELNPGDWITLSKQYAKTEARDTTKVYAHKVKAKDVHFAGDDINEFGYYPATTTNFFGQEIPEPPKNQAGFIRLGREKPVPVESGKQPVKDVSVSSDTSVPQVNTKALINSVSEQSLKNIQEPQTNGTGIGRKMSEFFQGLKGLDKQIQEAVGSELKNTSPTKIARKQVDASPLNVKRLDLNTDQQGRVMTDQVKEIRDVLSNKEVEQIAKAAGFDTKTHTIEQTRDKIAEQLNIRRQVVELENQRTQMIQDGASDEELVAVAKQIAETSRISREQGTHIARQLSARRIIANEINTPMQRVFQLLDKAGVNPDEYAKDAAKLDFTDGNAVVDFYRKYVPANASNWLDLVRYNSMLSSPNTHINNFFSNLEGSLLVAPVEKEITAGIDALKSALTGSKREYASGEGVAYAKGYLSSVGDAVNRFSSVMKGDNLSQNLDYRAIPLSQSGTRARKYENILQYPMRLLEAGDQFFTALTEGGVKASLERRQDAGIKVQDINKFAVDEAGKRLFRSELGANEGSVVLNAIDTVANTVQGLKGSKNPVVSTMAKFTLPFLRTPTNILKQGLEYSPFGVTTLPGAKDKTEQLAKAVMGTSIAMGTSILLGSDRITFAEPTSEKQKNAFRAAGMQPYSVKVGDKWVSYSKLHPAIAFNLALVAAVKDASENGNLNDTQVDQILTGASNWLNFFADQSYVKSIGDLVAGTKGDIDRKVRIGGNYVTQLIPFRALMGWVARISDPYQRQVDPDGSALQKQFDYIKTQIPVMSMTIPARTDETGDPVPNQNRWLNAFSPNRVTAEIPEKKEEYNWIREKYQLDKENRQLKEQLKKEAETGITAPQVQASDEFSPLVENEGKIRELTKQEEDRLKVLLDYGRPVPVNDLVSYYLKDIPTETGGYKDLIRNKALLKEFDKVETDEDLSREQKDAIQQTIVQESGYPQEDITYWQQSKYDNDIKYRMARDEISSFTSKDQVLEYLMMGRRSILGEQFATDALINQFYDDGYLTKEDSKQLKDLEWDEITDKPKTEVRVSGSGSGSSSSQKKFFQALNTPPKLSTSDLDLPASRNNWGQFFSSPFSQQDASVNVDLPTAPNIPTQQIYQPKAKALSLDEARRLAYSVGGGSNSSTRLSLRYAGGRR